MHAGPALDQEGCLEKANHFFWSGAQGIGHDGHLPGMSEKKAPRQAFWVPGGVQRLRRRHKCSEMASK